MPPCRRVRVYNIAKTSTEDSLRDFFSFCGDIKLIQLYPSETEGEGQEAVIVFETESGASTAVLLDNAVVDGERIRVEAFPETVGGGSGPAGQENGTAPGASNKTSPTQSLNTQSVLDDVLSETLTVANNIGKSAKQFDQQYDVSGKMSAAAASVASAAMVVDEKLHVRENAAYVYENARKSAVDLDQKLKISETVGGWMGSVFGWKSDSQLNHPPKPQSNSQGQPSSAPMKSRSSSPRQQSPIKESN